MNLNLVTVCTGDFPMEYVEKNFNMVSRNLQVPFTAHCITDRPDQLPAGVNYIPHDPGVSGWWNKLKVFSNEMPEGYIMYMDLDIVVLQDFTEEVNWMLDSVADHDLIAVEDAIHWLGERFSSSFMFLESGKLDHIYRNFDPSIQGRDGGDQVWVGPQLKNPLYVDGTYPTFKQSLRFHLMDAQMPNQYNMPTEEDVAHLKCLDVHGLYKPHTLTGWPVIQKHWR